MKQKIVKTKLPRKPSDLLALALDNLRKVERSKKYKVCMGAWHSPGTYYADPCAVCLAGAVMAKTLGASPEMTLVPHNFSEEDKLDAIDSFRVGEWGAGFNCMGVSGRKEVKAYNALCADIDPVVSYHNGRDEFHRTMRKAVRIMRKHGV